MTAPTLFVTGMQRSGTTLLDRLLEAHPGISLLSQPFPFLFLEAKREFFRRSGWEPSAYPLGHLFLEDRYGAADLARFLREWQVDAPLLREVFAAMDGFSGQCTRFDRADLDAALDGLAPAGMAAVVAHLCRELSGAGEGVAFGGKETICEEFLPHLLDSGFRCLVILRDPRDVLASLNHGRGRDYGGRLKPTLFNLRNWRKSAAFSLYLEDRPGFCWIRYEDLVSRPLEVLDRVAPVLGVDPFPEDLLSGGLRDRNGRAWSGNSSHGARPGVSSGSVGIHQRLLPAGVARLVEAVCYPELVRLGYPVSLRWDEVPGIVRSFEDPYPVERGELPEASDAVTAAAQEIRRIEILPEPPSEATRPFFLFREVHATLQNALLQ